MTKNNASAKERDQGTTLRAFSRAFVRETH